jgi:hypothetical protein
MSTHTKVPHLATWPDFCIKPLRQYFPTKCHFPDTLLMESPMQQDQFNVKHAKQGLVPLPGDATWTTELGNMTPDSSPCQAATHCSQTGGNFLPQWF